MFTHTVRQHLAQTYGIRDIPQELLEYFIMKYRQSLLTPQTLAPESTVAWAIANEWQRGLRQSPLEPAP